MAFLPLAERPIAYIDTETTGLSATYHEVLEVAVVFDRAVAERLRLPHLVSPEGEDYSYYCTKLAPQYLDRAHPKALQVNGFTKEAWAGAPTFNQVAPVLSILLKDVVVCGHNVGFDADFLQDAFRRIGSDFRFDSHKLDTVTLAYAHLVRRGLTKLSLDTIREFLGWSKEGAHGALQDALDARRLYKLLTPQVQPVTGTP